MSQQKAKLRNSHKPQLSAGNYTLTIEQSFGFGLDGGVSGNTEWRRGDFKNGERPPLEQRFEIGIPEVALAPGDVVSCYPPNGASAAFGRVIPHITLRNSMLPWMKQNNGRPWLALLIFSPEDDEPVGEMRTDPEEHRTKLVLRAETFEKIAPRNEELGALAHVRVRGDTQHAVILSRSLPAKGALNTACLVSIIDAKVNGDKVELPCLKSWRFTCTEDKSHFHSVFDDLDTAPLRLPLFGSTRDQADRDGRDAADRLLATGHVPLAWSTVEGEETVTWYRGPLVPGPVGRKVATGDRATEMHDLPKPFARAWDVLEHFFGTDGQSGEPVFSADGHVRMTVERDPATGDRRIRVTIERMVSDDAGRYANRNSLQYVFGRFPLFGDTRVITTLLDRNGLKGVLAGFDNDTDNPYKRGTVPLLIEGTPFQRGEDLVRHDGPTGLEDVTFAVAWQIGRLLGLADKAYRVAVLDWRRECAQCEAQTMQAEDCAHLCCRPASINTAFPEPVDSFLCRLAALDMMPLDYLLPSERLLPRNSLRTFSVDPVWIYRLLQGALSIGREACPCETAERQAMGHLRRLAGLDEPVSTRRTGVFLRGEAVSAWPELAVSFSPGTADAPAPMLSRPTPDILLAFNEGSFDRVELRLPEANPHYEFREGPPERREVIKWIEECLEEQKIDTMSDSRQHCALAVRDWLYPEPDGNTGVLSGLGAAGVDLPDFLEGRYEVAEQVKAAIYGKFLDHGKAEFWQPFHPFPDIGSVWTDGLTLGSGVQTAQRYRVASHVVRISVESERG